MSWRTQAACLDRDPSLFFLEKGDNQTGRTRAAKAICATCPVRVECLDYAVSLRLMYGVWGGLTYTQRRRIWQEAA